MPNKFFAKHFIDEDGIKWDSKREYQRMLELLGNADEISDLDRQITFELLPKQRTIVDKKLERSVNYTCDFIYVENKTLVIEDVKSAYTRKEKDYILRRKMFKYFYLNEKDKNFERLHTKFPELDFDKAVFKEVL